MGNGINMAKKKKGFWNNFDHLLVVGSFDVVKTKKMLQK
jgi:hypothetical protein